MKTQHTLIKWSLFSFCLVLLSACADLKEIHDILGEPAGGVVKKTFPAGQTHSTQTIDDVFARLDAKFHFQDPNDYGDTQRMQWLKLAGAKFKAIPGVSYEIFQPFSAYKGKLRSAYAGYTKKGLVWLWLDLKKDGAGTAVRYRTSGSQRLHQPAQKIEQWVLQAVNG